MAIDLATATALETARAIANGDVTALEACDAAIARIEAKDGPINAVVVRDFERGRSQAKAADARRAKGERAPLLGVPMTVKESNDVAGLPTTWGFPQYKDAPVTEDALAVQRLKEAGAVIIGKTNVPVALADWQAVNPIYGRTRNPHNHERSAGGSSGGGAAALASGLVPLEFGSDIGGSIRVPAALNGVFGLKPTYGVIPLKGHTLPGFDTVDAHLAVVGPLARSVDDLVVAFDAVAGPTDDEAVGWRHAPPPPRCEKLSEARVLMLDGHPVARTALSVRDALHDLADRLGRMGAKVSTSSDLLPDLAAAHSDYIAMLMPITQRGAPGATPIDVDKWFRLLDKRMHLQRQWRALFQAFDVVITPAFGVTAFPHTDEPDWSKRTLTIDGEATPYGAQIGWPGIATFPGLPAVAAPVGRDGEGLPIGVQIIAARYEDNTALAFARAMQREGLAQAITA
jgi:amidase